MKKVLIAAAVAAVVVLMVLYLLAGMRYYKVSNRIQEVITKTPPTLYTVRYILEKLECFSYEKALIDLSVISSNLKFWTKESIICFRLIGAVMGGVDASRIKVYWKQERTSAISLHNYGTLVIEYPEPEILGVNVIDYSVEFVKGWESIPFAAKREIFIRMQNAMREEAVNMGIKEDAEASFRHFVTLQLKPFKVNVEFKRYLE